MKTITEAKLKLSSITNLTRGRTKRMKYSLKSFLFLLPMLLASTGTAQNPADAIQYQITGRMLMDGGIYLKNPADFGNGTELISFIFLLII